MKTMILPTLLALGAAMLSAHPAQAADEFFVTIIGAHQGHFRGESTQKDHIGQITGLKYDYSAAVPLSPTGHATGQVRQMPVVFEKEWGAATTQIYQALVTNEVLRRVTFEFFSTDSEGRQRQVFRATLTNASIISLHQHVGDAQHDSTLDPRRYEDISLSFQKIEIADESSSAGSDAGEQARRVPAVRPARPS